MKHKRVRLAATSDILAISLVAANAWTAAYRGLLPLEAIETFVGAAYSPARLAERMNRGRLYVGVEGSEVTGFADTVIDGTATRLTAIYVAPAAWGRGIGSLMLDEIARFAPNLPIVAGVLVGNARAEAFYASRGFRPGRARRSRLFPSTKERQWERPPLVGLPTE